MLVTSEQFDRVCYGCPFLGVTKKVDFLSDGPISLDCFEVICPLYLLSKDSSDAMKRVWPLLTGSDKPFHVVWQDVTKRKSHKELSHTERRTMVRQRRLLLNSLLEHTLQMGWWQAYKEYHQAWDRCILAYAEPRDEAVIAEMRQRMEKSIEKIQHDLDPLVLRPQILRTRCEICPA